MLKYSGVIMWSVERKSTTSGGGIFVWWDVRRTINNDDKVATKREKIIGYLLPYVPQNGFTKPMRPIIYQIAVTKICLKRAGKVIVRKEYEMREVKGIAKLNKQT